MSEAIAETLPRLDSVTLARDSDRIESGVRSTGRPAKQEKDWEAFDRNIRELLSKRDKALGGDELSDKFSHGDANEGILNAVLSDVIPSEMQTFAVQLLANCFDNDQGTRLNFVVDERTICKGVRDLLRDNPTVGQTLELRPGFLGYFHDDKNFPDKILPDEFDGHRALKLKAYMGFFADSEKVVRYQQVLESYRKEKEKSTPQPAPEIDKPEQKKYYSLNGQIFGPFMPNLLPERSGLLNEEDKKEIRAAAEEFKQARDIGEVFLVRNAEVALLLLVKKEGVDSEDIKNRLNVIYNSALLTDEERDKKIRSLHRRLDPEKMMYVSTETCLVHPYAVQLDIYQGLKDKNKRCLYFADVLEDMAECFERESWRSPRVQKQMDDVAVAWRGLAEIYRQGEQVATSEKMPVVQTRVKSAIHVFATELCKASKDKEVGYGIDVLSIQRACHFAGEIYKTMSGSRQDYALRAIAHFVETKIKPTVLIRDTKALAEIADSLGQTQLRDEKLNERFRAAAEDYRQRGVKEKTLEGRLGVFNASIFSIVDFVFANNAGNERSASIGSEARKLAPIFTDAHQRYIRMTGCPSPILEEAVSQLSLKPLAFELPKRLGV